jgi:hypothetical protein
MQVFERPVRRLAIASASSACFVLALDPGFQGYQAAVLTPDGKVAASRDGAAVSEPTRVRPWNTAGMLTSIQQQQQQQNSEVVVMKRSSSRLEWKKELVKHAV